MHDTHCHLDLYEDPNAVAIVAERQHITTIAVTNLPSAYYEAKPHMGRFRHLKLAVGLHPLMALHHSPHEKSLFRRAVLETEFVGEVGLDFSKQGLATKAEQLVSFEYVLQLLQENIRFVTLHSRQAESAVLDLLKRYNVRPVIFHWYSGPLKVLDSIVEDGHYLSVNTAMTESKHGQSIITRLPYDRILTETDGPFIKFLGNPAQPPHVQNIHNYLSQLWGQSPHMVSIQLENNLLDYLKKVKRVA